jgi:hypothetical protein
MKQLTPISSHKRSSPDDETSSDDLSRGSARRIKCQRTLSPSTASSSDLHLFMPCNDAPPTPPASAERAATMALRLVIPQEATSREQQRMINRHRADAERWKPKLQRPYPNKTEIKSAYPLKLMRHYSDAPAQSDLNFVKPKIDDSPRVSRLLEQFPLIDTTQPVKSKGAKRSPSPTEPLAQMKTLSSRKEELTDARQAHGGLQSNITITQTEQAQRLAWQSFAQTERDRMDRGREAMIQSGLFTDDMKMELAGQRNKLPEWKKCNTGRFAREHGSKIGTRYWSVCVEVASPTIGARQRKRAVE